MHILRATEFKTLDPTNHVNLSFFHAQREDIKYLQALVETFIYSPALTINASMREGEEQLNINVMKYLMVFTLDFDFIMDFNGLEHTNILRLIVRGREQVAKIVNGGDLRKAFPLLENIHIMMHHPNASLTNQIKNITLEDLEGAWCNALPEGFFRGKKNVILKKCHMNITTQLLIEVGEGLSTCVFEAQDIPGFLFANLETISTLTATKIEFHVQTVENYESLLNLYRLASDKTDCQWNIIVTIEADIGINFARTPYENFNGFQQRIRTMVANVNDYFNNIQTQCN